MKTRNIVQVDCQVQILSVAIFLMIFGAHMNILFIIKVKILELIK
jgi:hypothetical protein